MRSNPWHVSAGASRRPGLASRIEPEWLLDLFPDRVREAVELEWSDPAERVEAFSRLTYDGLVIEESRSQAAAASSSNTSRASRPGSPLGCRTSSA
jgi:hypothetical protein